jgi:type II secretion system protein N
VKRFGRVLFLCIGAVVLCAGIFLIGLNLYVQSRGTHARIQQELSQRLGTSLQLRRISVTPWGGLELSGITIPQNEGAVGGNFLEAETFGLRVEFWSLFSRRLVIKQVSLVRPKVVWAQNAAGQWRIPETPHEINGTPSNGARLVEPATGAAAPAAPREQRATPAPAPETENAVPADFTPEIRRVNLKGGNFRFLDAAGKIVANFQGVDFHSSPRTASAVKGNASISKISLRDKFYLERLQSPIQYDPNGLTFSQISARAAEGELQGRFELRPQTPGSPFTVDVHFRELHADKLVTDAGGPAGMVQGRLEGHLAASGKTSDADALEGRGEIFLRDGQLQQYSILVALGQILQIDELTQLHLDQAQVKYHISPGLVTIDELLLRSPNIRLSATGTITFGGKLRLESQLALNEKIRGQLFRPLRQNFQPTSEPGYAAVDFQVSGTVEKPKTNLMDKVVGHELKDLGSVISGFLGDMGRGKKKKAPREAPSPVPAASPALSPNENSPAPSVTPAPSP